MMSETFDWQVGRVVRVHVVRMGCLGFWVCPGLRVRAVSLASKVVLELTDCRVSRARKA